ncbi:MAG: citrate/2-methylcitrate synthase [Planctomycetota bacterium]|jgi:citrate synthase
MGDLGDKKGIGNLDDPKMPYDYSAREYGTVPMDTKRAPFQWVSEVAYKNVHRIVARGYDTTELVEEGYGVVDILFVDFQARLPLIEEEQMLNYIMILSLEDGLSTPAAMSRLVAGTKTFLTQACGASILSFGHAYGAYSSFGNMLDGYMVQAEEEGKGLAEIAEVLVAENLGSDCLGVSGLMLKDPAAQRMIARAEKLGVAGKHIELMKHVVEAAKKASDKPVDIDMLGAIGATMMDLGFTPEATWAILAVTRSFGAGAHYIEEVEREQYTHLGEALTPEEDYDGPADRPVPPLAERDKHAKPAQTFTPDQWRKAFDERMKIHGSGFAIIEEIEDPSKMTGTKSVGKKLH